MTQDGAVKPAQHRVGAALTRLLAGQRQQRQQRPSGITPRDLGIALVFLVGQTLIVFSMPSSDGRTPGLLGWTLLSASALVLVFRSRAPWLTTVAVIALIGPYHAQDFVHSAAVPAGLFAMFSLTVRGPPLRSFLTLGATLSIMATVMATAGKAHDIPDMMRGSGWLVAFVLIGEAVRIHRNYVSAIVERAERAERTREEEAARRVAEERLRIARDLHDLLAHSITLIGVQTSVAAHVLVADPDRLDRETVARALDGIADTCRDARAELRTTLEVLRADDTAGGEASGGAAGPLPGLSGVPDLVRAAEGAGARVRLRRQAGDGSADGLEVPVPPAVGAAAYRIVQESLTNAVRHAGREVGISVALEPVRGGTALRVSVTDDGGPAGRHGPGGETETPAGPPGYGIVGMRERARSVGGTLDAEPCPEGPGFRVTAILPLAARTDPAGTSAPPPALSAPSVPPGPALPAPAEVTPAATDFADSPKGTP